MRELDELLVVVAVVVLVTSGGRLDPCMSGLVGAGGDEAEGVMYDQSVNSVSRG